MISRRATNTDALTVMHRHLIDPKLRLQGDTVCVRRGGQTKRKEN